MDDPMTIIHRREARIIHTHSRSQALAAGDVIDAGPLAREAGFTCPVAVTRAVWLNCVRWDTRCDGALQDETGRLWDVLWAGAAAARHGMHRELGHSSLHYTVHRVPHGAVEPEPVSLVLTAGPDDDAQLVLTIHEPGED